MGCFDAPQVSASDTPLQNQYASISREMFADYRRRFEPMLNQMIAESNDPAFVSNAVQEGQAGVADQFANARSNADITNQRYRLNLTPRQQEAADRELAHARATTFDTVSNGTRTAAADLQDASRLNLIGIGSGIQGEALGNMDTSVGLESQRVQNSTMAKAQAKSGMLSTIGSLAGTATGMFLLSDRDKKKGINKADPKGHLKEMVALPLYDYSYEDGIDQPGKRRTGTMWQESPTIRAATDERVLDLGDWNAKNTGAIQALNGELEALRREVLQLSKRAA